MGESPFSEVEAHGYLRVSGWAQSVPSRNTGAQPALATSCSSREFGAGSYLSDAPLTLDPTGPAHSQLS